MGFICVSPRFDKFFLKVFIDRFVWSRGSGNGQDPVLRASFPFVDVWAIHIGEGMGDFPPWVCHDQVRSIYELVKAKFVEETISLLSISVENEGFSPLEWFVILSDWDWVLWELWWRSRWWC